MTLDISELNPEKKAFFKVNPELLKGIEKAIPGQVRSVQNRKKKINKGKQKWQRDIENIDNRVADAKRDADNLRRKYMMDPDLREIEQKMMLRIKPLNVSNMVCPNCGEGDHGNKMNKTPWCMKCNIALIDRNSSKTGRRQPKIRFIHKDDSLKKELNRLNPGLNPNNKDK